MITGASTTWCQVVDMSRAIAFYRDVLGLTVLMESPYWTELRLGEGKIALHRTLKADDGLCGEVGRGWYLGMTTGDVVALRNKLIQKGGAEHGLHQTPGGVVLTFTDPDGNPIQAMQVGAKLEDLRD